MAIRGYIGAITVAVAMGTSGAQAQSVGVPAEFPPASFTGNQYVDSNGCAFIRAGIAGAVDWVPRVNRQRQPLCNFQPSLSAANPVATPAPIDPDLIIQITPPAQAAAPEPAPVQTIASIPAATAPAGPTAPIPPIITPPPFSPRVVTAPAPVEPARQAAAPTVTMAQACEGRFGVQAGFVSSRTGNPIDCGPSPVAAAPAVAEPPRMTMAQICAEVAATGQRFVNARTGEAINCAPAAPLVITAAPSVPAGPAAPGVVTRPTAPAPVASATSLCEGIPNMRSDGRYSVRCGPQAERPFTEATAPAVTRSRVSTSSAPIWSTTPEVPASNPAISSRAPVPNPPAGYERIWNDGRINPQRGLQVSAAEQPVEARVSTRSAPITATGHRYVQVASFGTAANADRLIAQLGGLGLPVASGRSGGLKVVAAGPFGDAAALARALQTIRGLGFGDAYTRN